MVVRSVSHRKSGVKDSCLRKRRRSQSTEAVEPREREGSLVSSSRANSHLLSEVGYIIAAILISSATRSKWVTGATGGPIQEEIDHAEKEAIRHLDRR